MTEAEQGVLDLRVSKTILMFMCEFKCSPSLCRSEALKINFQKLEMYFPGPMDI